MATPKSGVGSGSGTNAKRTPSGSVSAAARAKTGTGSDKKYPLPDKQAANSAINLRNNSNSMSGDQVLDKVARSKFGSDPQIKAKITKAKIADKKKSK
jgi:hypothetical protein